MSRILKEKTYSRVKTRGHRNVNFGFGCCSLYFWSICSLLPFRTSCISANSFGNRAVALVDPSCKHNRAWQNIHSYHYHSLFVSLCASFWATFCLWVHPRARTVKLFLTLIEYMGLWLFRCGERLIRNAASHGAA